jgi:predicted amidophosphoribosyltransferase
MEIFAPKVACPKCGTQVKAQAKFCFNCGAPMSAAGKLQDNHWARQPGDFAVRIGGDNMLSSENLPQNSQPSVVSCCMR